MKKGPDTLGTTENVSGSAKYENGTRRPQYRRKRVPEGKTSKRDLTSPIPPKMSPGAQNMNMGPDALGTAENESRCAKHEYGTRRPRYRRKRVRTCKTRQRDSTHSALPKTSLSAQNMKMGNDAPDTTENESGRAKHENGIRRTRYRQTRVWARKIGKRDPTPLVPSKTSLGAQNMKKGTDALGTVENESRSAKHENGNRRPRYSRKRVRERKT
jgi:hypothetical protein